MPAFDYHVTTEPRQCLSGEGHPEFVARGLRWAKAGRTLAWSTCPQCQSERRERLERQWDFGRRYRGIGGIPQRFADARFDNFRADQSEQVAAVQVVREYVDGWADLSLLGAALVLLGRTGTGKTHMAAAICNALPAGTNATYITVADAVREVRTGHRGTDKAETENEILNSLGVAPDLLILDEVGANFDTPLHAEIAHELIDRRYRSQKSFVLISNLDRAALAQYLGERAMDRLSEVARLVPFAWASERKAA